MLGGMNFFESLLAWDTQALIWAAMQFPREYAPMIQILAELIVIWVALFLVWLWLSGVRTNQTEPKIRSLHIAVLILCVFGIYSVINLGLPQWRESPQNVVESIGSLIPRPADNSFPSGHSLFTGAFLVGLWLYMRR